MGPRDGRDRVGPVRQGPSGSRGPASAHCLADSDQHVARRAALGLLEPETRSAAGLNYQFESFEFENIPASTVSSPGRGPAPVGLSRNQAPFLDQARRLLVGAAPEDSPAFALLLAQYGDFSGLDRLLGNQPDDVESRSETALAGLTGIALSRDTKVLAVPQESSVAVQFSMDFQEILQAMKGMNGPKRASCASRLTSAFDKERNELNSRNEKGILCEKLKTMVSGVAGRIVCVVAFRAKTN